MPETGIPHVSPSRRVHFVTANCMPDAVPEELELERSSCWLHSRRENIGNQDENTKCTRKGVVHV